MKFLLNLVLKIRRLYWWVIRPQTHGVRALVFNKQGEILLVKHKYGEGWFLPGGKMKSNESPENGLKRELNEELGIASPVIDHILGVYTNIQEYKKDTITVYAVKSFTIEEKSHFEIQSKSFFSLENLPSDISPGTKRRVLEYLGRKQITPDW